MFTLPTAATIKVNIKTASTPLYVFMTIGYLVRYPFWVNFTSHNIFARQTDGYNLLETVFLHLAFVSSSIHLRAALQRESIHTHTQNYSSFNRDM